MKTTVKEYQIQLELRKNLKNSAENTYFSDLDLSLGLKKMADEIDETYFNKLDTVSVSYLIGSRSYYGDVVKIGKTYFSRGVKMTRSRGYWCIKEIPQVTNEMTDSMIADSYYY